MLRRLICAVVFITVFPSVTLSQTPQLLPDILVRGESYVSAVAQAANGDYLIAGVLDHVNGVPTGQLIRVDQHGNLVPGFNRVEVNYHILKVAEQANGKILMAGWFSTVNGQAGSLVRLNANGTIDNTFSKLQLGPHQVVDDFALQSDGKIVAVGSFSNGTYSDAIRLNANGTVDNTFGHILQSGNLARIVVDASDKLYIGNGLSVLKYEADGQVIPGFSVVANGFFYNLFLRNNKLIIGGEFTTVNGSARKNVAVIMSDGSLDPFSANLPGVSEMAITADGKFIISTLNDVTAYTPAGEFIKLLEQMQPSKLLLDAGQRVLIFGGPRMIVDGVDRSFSARLASDFSLDGGFNCEITYTWNVRSMAITHEGKIYLGATDYCLGIGPHKSKIIRLHNNGTVDESFTTGLSPNVNIASMAIDNEKLLVTTDQTVFRLTDAGAQDPSFTAPMGLGYVRKVKVKGDYVYVCGAFDAPNGFTSPGIIRLLKSGAVDETFVSQLPGGSFVTDFAFHGDTAITVAGNFYSGPQRKSVLQLKTSTGDLSETFTAGVADANGIWRVESDSEGNIYLGGDFINYSGTGIDRIIKLFGDGTIDHLFDPVLPFEPNSSVEAIEVLSNNEVLLGASNYYDDKSFAVFNGAGAPVSKSYSSYGESGSVTFSQFDGSRLYLVGRIVEPDRSAIAGIAYIDLYDVSGTIQNLEGSRIDAERVTLSWTLDVMHHAGLIVERSTGTDPAFITLDTLTKDRLLFVDTNAPGTDSYNYRIRAFNSHSVSAYSSVATIPAQAEQEITFEALENKTIGDASFMLIATASSGLPVSFSSSNPAIAEIANGMVTMKTAGAVTITASQAGNEIYYTASPIERSLTINKKSQEITFGTDPIEKTFGDAAFTLGATASSLLAVSFTSSNPAIAEITSGIVTIKTAGTVTITASQAGNESYYAATPVERSLTINKKSQQITFDTDPIEKTFGDPAFMLKATASSSLAVSFTSSNPLVASVSGSTVTILKAGTVTLTASQPGDASYASVTPKQRMLSIAKAGQTITFFAIPEREIEEGAEDNIVTLLANSSSGLAVSFESADESIATIDGDQAKVLKPGDVTIRAVQNGNENFKPATTVEQVLRTTLILGVEDQKNSGVSVFPNPGNGLFHVTFDSEFANGSYRVLSVTGETKFNGAFDAFGNDVQLNVTSLPSGIYVLQITKERRSAAIRLHKQ